MNRMHLDGTGPLKAIDLQISQLKAACQLTDTDQQIFDSLAVPLRFAADSPEARACQRLKGLYFLRSFISYQHLQSLRGNTDAPLFPRTGF